MSQATGVVLPIIGPHSTSDDDDDDGESVRGPVADVGARGRVSSALKSLETPVSVIGGTLGLASVPIWAFQLFGSGTPRWLTSAYVCLTGVFFIVAAVVLQIRLRDVVRERNTARSERDQLKETRWIRARRLARAQPVFAEIFKHLGQASLLISQGGDDLEAIRVQGRNAAHRLAEVLSAVTGAPCRATVKEAYMTSAGMAVRDVFRTHDAPIMPPGHVDLVAQNTHFEEILARGSRGWTSNDLTAEYALGYTNSHITRDQVARNDLPYRSILVVKIAAPGLDSPDALAGFVCVDSHQPGIFRENFDVSPVLAAANAMYSVLTWYRQVASTPSGGQPNTGEGT